MREIKHIAKAAIAYTAVAAVMLIPFTAHFIGIIEGFVISSLIVMSLKILYESIDSRSQMICKLDEWIERQRRGR